MDASSIPIDGGNYTTVSRILEGGVTKDSVSTAAIVSKGESITGSIGGCSIRSEWKIVASVMSDRGSTTQLARGAIVVFKGGSGGVCVVGVVEAEKGALKYVHSRVNSLPKTW